MGEPSKRRFVKTATIAIIIGLITAILVSVLYMTGLFDPWEMKTYDLRMVSTRANRTKPANVAIFYVDEASLRFMGQQKINWPWPRELYSAALNFCKRGGAKAVLFDLFYSEDSVYGVEDDAAFASGVQNGPPSYFVLFSSKNEAAFDDRDVAAAAKSSIPFQGEPPKWLEGQKSLQSLPIWPLIDTAKGLGNAEAAPDPDGVYRRITPMFLYENAPLPSVSFKMASDLENVESISWPNKKILKFGGTDIPLDDSGSMLINYYGGTDIFPNYSLAEVIVSDAQIVNNQEPNINPSVIKDKVVIVGVAAPGLYDMKSSPFSKVYPGAEVHATVIENLLTKDFLASSGLLISILIIAIVSLLTAMGLAVLRSWWEIVILLVAIFIVLVGSSFLLFYLGISIPLVAPFTAYALASFSVLMFRFMTEGKKKREIRRAFGQYLSPHIVKKIAESPESLKLGGEEKEITIFFSDIANFTSISEKTPPSELVSRLNRYFSVATEVIQKHDGTLDKYIGDAIMAFWGAPLEDEKHASNGVNAALEIQKTLKKMAIGFETRIGIHTDQAIVGNVGSNIRFNYTAIGDAVNLASRLEGINKQFGTNIIISESTYEKTLDLIEARKIGRIRVKGRKTPINIYEPVGKKGEFGYLHIDPIKTFARALSSFEDGNFGEAEKIFNKVLEVVPDPVSKIYIEYCRKYLQNPPRDFDGAINFETK